MAHCQKIKLCDAKRVFDEVFRSADHYKNNVDPLRCSQNYVLSHGWGSNDVKARYMRGEASHITGGLVAGNMNARLSGLQFRSQKNTIGVCDWVVTCPEEFKDKPDMQERFFKTVYNYTLNRYGEDNVLFAAVHNDETTPHIHIPVIPVIEKNHLCSRKFLTTRELVGYQKDLEDVCEHEFGLKGLILNGRTKGNYTLDELKQRSHDEEDIQNRRKQAAELERSAREHERQARLLVEQLKTADEQFRTLMKDMDEEQRTKYITRRNKLITDANTAKQAYVTNKQDGFQK